MSTIDKARLHGFLWAMGITFVVNVVAARSDGDILPWWADLILIALINSGVYGAIIKGKRDQAIIKMAEKR